MQREDVCEKKKNSNLNLFNEKHIMLSGSLYLLIDNLIFHQARLSV